MKKSILVFAIALLTWINTAIAAQDSTVVRDNAPIRMEPKSGAKVLEYIPVGSEVRISSYPMTGGWYKIRSRTGVYGWVHEDDLSVYKPKDAKPGDPKEKKQFKPERDRKFFLRGFGGFDFFRPEDLNSLYAFSDLNTGYYVGGELGYFISERIALVFRTEAMLKDVVAKETSSNLFFNLAVRSYPVMGGADFHIVKLPAMRLSFGIYGGMALATSFSSEAPGLAAPNIMVLQRSPFTSLARLNLTRPLGRIFSVFLELGYRYLRVEDVETTAASGISGGPQIFAKDGSYRPRTIDLSGAILGAGIGLHF